MKYNFIRALSIRVLSVLSVSAAAFIFAANSAEVSADNAAGALADRFVELGRREAEIHAQQQDRQKDDSTANDSEEIEWQKKFDALSSKLRLARKTFKSASTEVFDFSFAPRTQAQPVE